MSPPSNIDVSGFILGLPSKVSPPVNLLSAGPQTIMNEAGESFRVIGTRLGGVILLVGARVRESADLSDSRLRSQTDRFVQALNESKDADYVKASRKLDPDIDYAAVSDRGALLAAGGGIPLQAEPLKTTKFRAVGPRRIRQSTYFLASAVVRSTGGAARGYVLYNYKDKPEDLFVRVQDLLAWGVAAYPMRYQPLSGDFAFEKDSYVSPAWTPEELGMVAAARRVIGYGGAFPPYEGLVKKFLHAKGFHEAFGLRTRRDREAVPATKRRKPDFDGFELREFAWDLLMMGRDHEFPVQALKRATV